VNTVAPGVTSTPGNAAAADVIEQMTRATVAGRPVRSVDVAFAVRWLVSDEAIFVHGTAVHVDGGITHTRVA
jgi:NAD(P)-dependent dehydrogenase (short-subunit alcohol dehydrogenase family)